jgi:hypothetical protein
MIPAFAIQCRADLAALALVAALPIAGCSSGGGGGSPTAPPPPDNPTPPVLQFVPDFQATSQAISFVPPSEDLNLLSVSVGFQHAGSGGITVETDFTAQLVRRGERLTVHVTRAWTWQASDYVTLGVSVRRPGQSRTFGLCCLGCSHSGGVLASGPCTRSPLTAARRSTP